MALTALESRPGRSLTEQARAIAHAARSLAEDAAAKGWAGQDESDVEAAAAALEQARAALGAVTATLLAHGEHEGLGRRLGWGSTSDWWTHLAGLRVGAGRRAVEEALALTGNRRRTLEQLAEGALSPEQAGVLVQHVEDLPVAPGLREEAERRLLESSRHLSATDLARAAGRLLGELDPGGAVQKAEARRDRLARAAHLRRFLSITDDGCGGVRVRGRGTVEDAAVLRAALLPLTAPVGAVDPATGEVTADPRDHGARLWDALIRVGQHALDTDLPPASHGVRPRVSVTVPLDVLRNRSEASGGARTDDGLELTPEAARRLACDADVVPAVLSGSGEVLDLGRETRVVSGALWRALVVRDGGCAFPGCSRPPLMCHAHHVVHWADGGPTSLQNLALLCGAHHRWVHSSPWRVRISETDGRPEFLPPTETGADEAARESEWGRQRTRPPSALRTEPSAPTGLPRPPAG